MRSTVGFVMLLALSCGFLIAFAGGLRAGERAPAKPKVRAVVLTGGHGYDRKEFPKAFAGHDDIAVEIRAPRKDRPSEFANVDKWPYDVMVLYNYNQKLSKPQRQNFLKLLDRGVGLVVLHHAIVAYPQWDQWERIIGCKYYVRPTERDGVKHPRSQAKHGQDMNIHVADPNHPITRGLKDFRVHDETYGRWTYFPGSRVLLTTDHPLNVQQIAWVKMHRNSRVLFFQLGHGQPTYSDESFRRVLARGIRWAARRIGKDEPKPAPTRTAADRPVP
jgi:type 1 glutamine amidotransferase